MNAYILCGGASRRMGRPKVMLPFQGKPMGIHIANVAEEAGFSPFFIAKGFQNFELPFPILVDQVEKRHPISGILRAMEHCSEEYFLLLPCDTPFLTSAALSQFLENPVRSASSSLNWGILNSRFRTSTRCLKGKYVDEGLLKRLFHCIFSFRGIT